MGTNIIPFQGEFCTYITYHPSGKFYLGKGITRNVLSGKYTGSGIALTHARKKYPKEEWTTSIIETFSSEDDAYLHEAFIVKMHFGEAGCLNLQGGGLGGRKASQETIEKNRQAQLVAQNNPETQKKRSETLRKVLNNPDVKKARSTSQKESWATEERQASGRKAQAAQAAPETCKKKSESMKCTLQQDDMKQKWKQAQQGMHFYYNPTTDKNTMAKAHPGEPWILGRKPKGL